MLGTVLTQLGRPDEALAELRAAIALRADSSRPIRASRRLLQRAATRAARQARLGRSGSARPAKADAQASAFALSVGRQKLKNGDRAAAIAEVP